MTSALSHSQSRVVTLDELREMRPPKPQGNRHRPVPHADLVEAVLDGVRDSGFKVGGTKFAVNGPTEARLFGTIDVLPRKGAEALLGRSDQGAAIGIRHGNDRSMALGMVAGSRVFVCDNMVFAGEFVVLRRKHTTGLTLAIDVDEALGRVWEKYHDIAAFVERLEDTRLSDQRAEHVIYRAFTDAEVLPVRDLPRVDAWYFHNGDSEVRGDDMSDIKPRSAWGLYNSFTRVIRDRPQHQVQEATTRLTRYFRDAFHVN